MADTRTHRGAHPKDSEIFSEKHNPQLRKAVCDLSLLLTRGYSMDASLKLVGDHLQLTDRQRLAVRRCSCSDRSKVERLGRRLDSSSCASTSISVDGFNLLITVEAALSGGVLLKGRDECHRDMSSIHGSYRSVTETEEALVLIGKTFTTLEMNRIVWYLDRPVSNSGRLKSMMDEIAQRHEWDWEVKVVFSPDRELVSCETPVISSDANILDHDVKWIDIFPMLRKEIPHCWIMDLSATNEPGFPDC